MTNLRTISIALVALLASPSLAHGAFDKSTIVKPSRGIYQSNSKQKLNKGWKASPSSVARNKTFKGIDTPYTFSYPDNWEVDTLKSAVFLSPVVSGYVPSVSDASSIALGVDRVPNKKDYSQRELDAYFTTRTTMALTVQEMDWYVPSFNLISSGSVMLAGKPAREYVYTGESRSVKYQYRLILASFDQQLFTVFYKARPEVFEKDQAVFNEVLKTLKIQQKKATSSAASSVISSRGRVRK
jgi:hypothetical protein